MMNMRFQILIVASLGMQAIGAATLSTCTIFEGGQTLASQSSPTQCFLNILPVGHAAANSTFSLGGNAGFFGADGYLNTSTYADAINGRFPEALATFEYGALLITPGPQRQGYLRYRFNIATTFYEPDSAITTWIGDTVFNAPVGGGCTICTGNQFLPITLGQDLSLYFLGRSYAFGVNNHGSAQEYRLVIGVFEADQTTLVSAAQILPTPEPGTAALVALGLLAAFKCRRSRAAS
jgi:hypothetical protein